MDEATAPNVSTFDVLSFIDQTEYPTDTVSIFTDVKAAHEYIKLNEEMDAASAGEEKFDPAPYEERLAELGEKLKVSSLTFELRGFAPGIVQAIMDKYDDADEGGADAELIARSIIAVLNAKGERDGRTWSADDVLKLRERLAEGQYMKLLEAVAGVLFNAAVFDRAVDAGFSG